jgi:hypothetical protein
MGVRWSSFPLPLQAASLAAALTGVGLQPAWGRTLSGTAHHHARHRPVRQAAAPPLRLRLPAPDDFSDGRSGERDFGFAPASSFDDRPPTAVDYRLTPHGPIGSLGLLRPSSSYAAPSTNVGQGSASRYGYPEVTAGAKLNYPF